jgi:hypothetical protein
MVVISIPASLDKLLTMLLLSPRQIPNSASKFVEKNRMHHACIHMLCKTKKLNLNLGAQNQVALTKNQQHKVDIPIVVDQ